MFGERLHWPLLLFIVSVATVGRIKKMAETVARDAFSLDELEDEQFINENLSYMNVIFERLQLRKTPLSKDSERRLFEFKCSWRNFFDPHAVSEPEHNIVMEPQQLTGSKVCGSTAVSNGISSLRGSRVYKMCTFCGRGGHCARTCRSRRNECYACGSGNHFMRECNLYERTHLTSSGFADAKARSTVSFRRRRLHRLSCDEDATVAANDKSNLRLSTSNNVRRPYSTNRRVLSRQEKEQMCSPQNSLPLKNRFHELQDECDDKLAGDLCSESNNEDSHQKERPSGDESVKNEQNESTKSYNNWESLATAVHGHDEKATSKHNVNDGEISDLFEDRSSSQYSDKRDVTQSDDATVKTPSKARYTWFTTEMKERLHYLQSKFHILEANSSKKGNSADDKSIENSLNWNVTEPVNFNHDLSEPNVKVCYPINALNNEDFTGTEKLILESGSDLSVVQDSFLGWLEKSLLDVSDELEKAKSISELGIRNDFNTDASRVYELTGMSFRLNHIISCVKDFHVDKSSMKWKESFEAHLNVSETGEVHSSESNQCNSNVSDVKVQLHKRYYKSYLYL